VLPGADPDAFEEIAVNEVEHAEGRIIVPSGYPPIALYTLTRSEEGRPLPDTRIRLRRSVHRGRNIWWGEESVSSDRNATRVEWLERILGSNREKLSIRLHYSRTTTDDAKQIEESVAALRVEIAAAYDRLRDLLIRHGILREQGLPSIDRPRVRITVSR
jgi:hypothetical protein